MSWLRRLRAWSIERLVDIDKTLNFLFNGNPDQTITYRAASTPRSWGRVVCWLLDLIDRGHCRRFGPKRDAED